MAETLSYEEIGMEVAQALFPRDGDYAASAEGLRVKLFVTAERNWSEEEAFQTGLDDGLQLAVTEGRPETAEVLLIGGASADQFIDAQGETLLHCAVSHATTNESRMVALLLAAGARADRRDFNDLLPEDRAKTAGLFALANTLREARLSAGSA